MRKDYYIKGMSCMHCESTIRKQLNRISQLTIESLSFETGKLTVKHKNLTAVEPEIRKAIENSGYELAGRGHNRFIPLASVMVLLVILKFVPSEVLNYLPRIEASASLGFLFLAGVLTSFHCITMCGGIALMTSMGSNGSVFKNSLRYNAGRILSYTLLGGIVGGIGSVLTVSNTFRSIFLVVIGCFMLGMGLNMAGVIPMPSGLKKGLYRIQSAKTKVPVSGSFAVGLLNGFMPCGPLQTMQLYALGTMSPSKGALSMLFFALGTTPLMLGFGSLRKFIRSTHQAQLMRMSGIAIMVFAVLMINRGMLWKGYSLEKEIATVVSEEPATPAALEKPYAPIVDGVQIVKMNVNGYYDLEPVKVKKDIPVKIEIDAQRITPCIDTITVPEYNVRLGLTPGPNEMTFTPTKEGDLVITCWMAMVTTYLEVE